MYKKILINLYHSGFYNAGYISHSKVKKMEDSGEKEILLNIFKYGIPYTNAEIEEAFSLNCEDGENEEKRCELYKILKEQALNFDYSLAEELDLPSIFDENMEEIFVEDMFAIQNIIKSILSKKEINEGVDEFEFFSKFEEEDFDEDKVFKIEAPFKEF